MSQHILNLLQSIRPLVQYLPLDNNTKLDEINYQIKRYFEDSVNEFIVIEC